MRIVAPTKAPWYLNIKQPNSIWLGSPWGRSRQPGRPWAAWNIVACRARRLGLVIPLRSCHSRKALYQSFSPLVADIERQGMGDSLSLSLSLPKPATVTKVNNHHLWPHGLTVKTNLHTSVLKLVFNRKAVNLIYWPSVLRP